MRNFSVRQDGNHLDLLGFGNDIRYRIDGMDLPPMTDHSFAIWHVLPLAIKEGFDIHIDGPTDPQVRENAERTSKIWELWDPSQYRSVRVSSTADIVTPVHREARSLTLYSGGVDSTFMILDKGRQTQASSVLTVHGMEYAPENEIGFRSAIEKTRSFLEYHNYSRVTVRSDIAKISGGHHSYAMLLAGFAWIFRDRFEVSYFAADLTPAQDMVLFPWGLNHVTNRLLTGEGYAIVALNEDVSRSQKIDMLSKDGLALDAITFCKDKKIRPLNCGSCVKCVRTKLAFLGMTGSVPSGVFISEEVPVGACENVSVAERAFLIDLYQHAKDRGNLGKVPELVRYVDRLRKPPQDLRTKLKRGRRALKAKVRSFIGR